MYMVSFSEVIVSFGDGATEDVYHDVDSARARAFSHEVRKTARRKLVMVAASTSVQDLRVPPGNRLEQLKGDLAGLWSIRVNAQWRITFRWVDGNAFEVKLTDYH
jgi:proteic killer suppression protein